MKIQITLSVLSAVLHFTTPGPGRFYLFSGDGAGNARVEASDYATNAVHVAVTVPRDATHRLFWAQFMEEAP